jgi:hypothetical protein
VSKGICDVQPKVSITAVGEEGTLEVGRGGWDSSPVQKLKAKFSETGSEAAGVHVDVEESFPMTSMDEELHAFLHAVSSHKAGILNVDLGLGDPGEGFKDLAMICALMEAGEKQQPVQIATISHV